MPERVIDRLGFLLNAYSVQCWYWEFLELIRKLLLTTLLAVMYHGEPPHLGGALLTTFVFLLVNIVRKPYLNQGLNTFQQMAMISHFLTLYGLLMFVVTGYMEIVLDTDQDANARTIVSYLIIISNAVSAGLYPMYRLYNAWAESRGINSDILNRIWNIFASSGAARFFVEIFPCLQWIKTCRKSQAFATGSLLYQNVQDAKIVKEQFEEFGAASHDLYESVIQFPEDINADSNRPNQSHQSRTLSQEVPMDMSGGERDRETRDINEHVEPCALLSAAVEIFSVAESREICYTRDSDLPIRMMERSEYSNARLTTSPVSLSANDRSEADLIRLRTELCHVESDIAKVKDEIQQVKIAQKRAAMNREGAKIQAATAAGYY